MRAKEDALRVLELALSAASPGVEDVEVALGGGELGLVMFAENQVRQAAEHTIETLMIRVCSRGKVCRAETRDLTAPGIHAAAQQARAMVEHLPATSESFGLPEPQGYTTVESYDAPTAGATGLDRLAAVGQAVIAAHKQNLRASGYMATCRGSPGLDDEAGGIYAVANTRGLLAYHPSTKATFRVSMMRTPESCGLAEDQSFAMSDLDIEALVNASVARAAPEVGLQGVPPGRYSVVLEAPAVASLVRFIAGTCGSRDADAGGSFLSGRIGERVAGPNVTVVDEHVHPLLRGRPFDIEGVAKKRVVIIEKGVAMGPVYCRESALRHEVEATGHRTFDPRMGEGEGASDIVMSGDSATLGDLVGGTKSGLLVSRLSSTTLVDGRTLSVSGTTSGGFFLIQNGEIVAPLRDMRFHVSVLDLLSNIEAMTDSVWASGLVVPAAKVHGFRFTAETMA